MSFERLGRAGLQWPVAADGTDAPILYEDAFLVGDGRARLAALPYKPPGDEADGEYPLILVTGRRLEHYNAGTMTRRTGNLELLGSETLEMHPDDAADRVLADGALVTVRSRRGQIELAVDVTDRIERGHVFCAFHFPEVRTNLLVGDSADVNTSVRSTRSSPSAFGAPTTSRGSVRVTSTVLRPGLCGETGVYLPAVTLRGDVHCPPAWASQ